jgi:hypothetical protein
MRYNPPRYPTLRVEALTEAHGVRWWVEWCLYEGHLFVVGLFMATLAAQNLVAQRYPKMTWFGLLLLPFCFWYLYSGWPGNPSPESLARQSSPADPAILLWIPIFMVMYWQRERPWSIVTIGIVTAFVVALMVRFRYKSSPIFTFIGWSLAVPLAFLPRWPNSQRFMLVLVLGSLITALQGGLLFARALRAIRKPSRSYA